MTGQQSEEDEKFSYGFSQQKVHDELVLQEDAYNRLNALYQISKLLSTFESVEDTFPKILTCGAKTFPLLTAVLVNNWENKTKTTIWHSEAATHEQVVSATLNARETFLYLTDVSAQSDDLKTDALITSEFSQTDSTQIPNENHRDNYIALPLIVDKLSVIGVLQLEGAALLNEQDLEFVAALANLIAIALDRHYKTRKEEEWRHAETKESSARLTGSQVKITDLETERDQREGFVSLLTHDLRTPLSAVKMAAQLILKNQDDPEVNKSLVGRILNNVNRADQMIGNLLDANRIRAGEKLSLNIESFDLSTLIKETLQELVMIHGDRFIFKANESAEGVWDRRGLRRIIENLCNNAIKYGDPNSPVILSVEQQKNNVQISVQNKGELISPEDQKSIFRQFKRTRKIQSGTKQGWGIGLTLVRGVAEAHGGCVTVKSENESGTVFTVTLPKEARPFIS